MTKVVNIHASCIRLARAAAAFGAPRSAGVLLLGDSGSGKSDLALRLIGRGAELVADDRTELHVERRQLIARAPSRLAGYIELRGLGIIELPHAGSVGIALVVDLAGKVKRLPARRFYTPPRALALPGSARPVMFALSAFDGSAPDKIIAAVAALRHKAWRDAVKSN